MDELQAQPLALSLYVICITLAAAQRHPAAAEQER